MSVKIPNDPLGNQTINLPACSQLRHRVPLAQPEILRNSKYQLQFLKCKVLEKIPAGTFFAAVKQVPSYRDIFLYVIITTNAVPLWDLYSCSFHQLFNPYPANVENVVSS